MSNQNSLRCYVSSSWSNHINRVSISYVIIKSGKVLEEFVKLKEKINGVNPEDLVLLPLLNILNKYKKEKDIEIITDSSNINKILLDFNRVANINSLKNEYYIALYSVYKPIKEKLYVRYAKKEEIDIAYKLSNKRMNDFIKCNYPNGIMQYAIDDLKHTKNKWESLFDTNSQSEVGSMLVVINNAINVLEGARVFNSAIIN